ncbi:MAG: O-antigen ligase family protein [Chloroflexales bacterium]|nr:O-antigen ligase family protein [Chloroflexales bacterium]
MAVNTRPLWRRLQPSAFQLQRSNAFAAIAALALGGLAGTAAAFGPLYAAAAVVGLAVGYAMLTSTTAGLLSIIAVITLLPFGTLPFKAIITPNFLELALAALMGVWVLRLLARPDSYALRLSPLGLPLLGFLGLTLFSLVLGSQGSPDTLTLHNYFKFVLAVLFCFSVMNCVRTREQARLLLRAVLLCGGLAALVGLVLWALNDDAALRLLSALGRIGYPTEGRVLRYIEAGAGTGRERAIGTSVDPNSFGGMLALIGGLALPQLFAPRPILRRWLLACIVALIALAVFLTNSRAALGSLVVAAVYIATLRYRRMWWAIALAGLVGLALIGSGLGEAFMQRVIEGVQFRDQANQMRLAEYQNALAIIGRYPVFGIGFGSAPEIDLVAGVSSIYLTIAERLGLVGLACFVGLVATFFAHSMRATRAADEETASWLLGVQAAIAAALAVGVLDHYFFNIEFSHMVALFWGCIGLGYAIAALED